MSPNSSTKQPAFTIPPPEVKDVVISFPIPHVLLVTLNRPKQLNSIPRAVHFELEALWNWFDEEPSLRCGVITGTGRAFCAGADLKEWNELNKQGSSSPSSNGGESSQPGASTAVVGGRRLPLDKPSTRFPPSGFGGLSNRGGLKPVVAAVNGICFGGGMEIIINCDLVVADAGAKFGLPEVTIGVVALAGALPRLVRTVGRQRAMEIALGGSNYTAQQMQAWGLVNEVVAADAAGEGGVVGAALRWAGKIAGNSPDAVVVSREGMKMGWEPVGPEQATYALLNGWYGRIEKGDNMMEGVRSFVERRKPVWKDSKL